MERMSRDQRSRGDLLVGAVCWILSVEYFVGQAIAQVAWKTQYSLLDNPISDLGNTVCGQWPPAGAGSQLAVRLGAGNGYVCSPLHDVMNISFIAAGLLMLLGVYFTRNAWPRRRLATWGLALLALSGLGKIVVGFVPENKSLLLHEAGGIGIPLSIIGILLLGLAVRQTHPRVATYSVVLASLGVIGLVVGFLAAAIGHGHGAAERLEAYPAFVWAIALGISFLLVTWSRQSARSAMAA
jgi:hypothetical membrane protein